MLDMLKEYWWPVVGSTLLYVSIVAIGWVPASRMGEGIRTFVQDVHTIAESIEENDNNE